MGGPISGGQVTIASGLSNGLGFGSTEFHVLRPNPDAILAEWLWYFIRNPQFRDEATYHFRGGVGQQRVPAEFLACHSIPLPPLNEQRRIVARIKGCMEHIDEIRRLRSENESVSPSLLPALLREHFDDLDAECPTTALGEVTLESRYGTSEKCEATYSGTPVLRIPNIADRRCNLEDLKYLARRVDATDGLLLRAGDLLIVRTNGSPDFVGRCAVVAGLDRPYGYASYLIRFRLDNQKVRPKYLSYFLSSTFGRDQIARLRRTSAGQYNINSESLRSIVIPLPPVEEQDAMVERMDRIESSVRDLQMRIAAEKTTDALLPAAVLRKAFAGEL